MSKRIFIPLRRKYFELFKQGKKRVELRSINSPVVRQFDKHFGYVHPTRQPPVELRCGYRGEALRGRITSERYYSRVSRIPQRVLELACVTREEAEELCGWANPVIAFGIELG